LSWFDFDCIMEIIRLCCDQLPGVAVLGTGRGKEYVAHAHQFVGLLKGNMDKRASSKTFHAWLVSEDGRQFREHDGGDLLIAMQKGPLEKKMYTYHLKQGGGGKPSVFLTVDGMRGILNGLPNADESVKRNLKEKFADYINQGGGAGFSVPLSFAQASPEQCAKDDADEGIEEISTEGYNPSNDTAMVVTQKMWYDVRISSFEYAADKRVLEAQLQAKDYVMAAKESAMVAEVAKERAEKELAKNELVNVKASADKDIQIVKERAEKESAKNELVNVKASADKDIQIAKLQMQLQLAEEKAKLRTDFKSDRLEREEKRDKVRRVGPVGQMKMHSRDTIFAKLTSASWCNDDASINSFFKLDNSSTVFWEPITVMPQLTVRFVADAEENNVPGSDFKHRAFGFCYRGPAISQNSLQKSDFIKEAYGVEVGGVHYVCVVFFKRFGQPLITASTLPYAFGLLPCTIMTDLVPGRDYHLAVYKAGIRTDDPVLEMIKHPSNDKWYWHSAASSHL
jgi:hypothetical protein